VTVPITAPELSHTGKNPMFLSRMRAAASHAGTAGPRHSGRFITSVHSMTGDLRLAGEQKTCSVRTEAARAELSRGARRRERCRLRARAGREVSF
jgi:hypothetical protein